MTRRGERPTVYVAASLSNREEALLVSLLLVDAGFCVTSRWLRVDPREVPIGRDLEQKVSNGQFLSSGEQDIYSQWEEYKKKWCSNDVKDMESADALVLLSTTSSSSGGYFVELGYFIGTNKPIVVFGERKNVFFYHRNISFIGGRNSISCIVTSLKQIIGVK